MGQSMDGQESLDLELLQARWILGGIGPEQLVAAAVEALERGFDGTALQQLAGLSGPTVADLGNLPARAFAEMGLHSIDEDDAIARLIARGQPSTSPVISSLLGSFPEFSGRWKCHIKWWGGESAGSYNDMSEFVHFVVEDLYEKGLIEEVRRAFQVLEDLFVEGDEEARNLIGLGFFETLQCFASWRHGGNKVYEQFLGPMSKRVWAELLVMWAGKSSLMEVIRAERKTPPSD
jgi:hypothetical protein